MGGGFTRHEMPSETEVHVESNCTSFPQSRRLRGQIVCVSHVQWKLSLNSSSQCLQRTLAPLGSEEALSGFPPAVEESCSPWARLSLGEAEDLR